MSTIGVIWSKAVERRRPALLLLAAFIIAGIVIIAVGEILEQGWTRIVGAGLISVASIAFGVLIGWSKPFGERIWAVAGRLRQPIVLVLTIIIAGPLVSGLALVFAGAIVSAGGDRPVLTATALLISLTFIALAAGTAVVSASLALRRRVEPSNSRPDVNGRGE
jgi:hypothetical protein